MELGKCGYCTTLLFVMLQEQL